MSLYMHWLCSFNRGRTWGHSFTMHLLPTRICTFVQSCQFSDHVARPHLISFNLHLYLTQCAPDQDGSATPSRQIEHSSTPFNNQPLPHLPPLRTSSCSSSLSVWDPPLASSASSRTSARAYSRFHEDDRLSTPSAVMHIVPKSTSVLSVSSTIDIQSLVARFEVHQQRIFYPLNTSLQVAKLWADDK